MKKKILIPILILGALAAAVVFGTVVYRSVRAAVPALTGVAHPGGPGRGLAGGYSNEDLATALGISVDELNAARQEAFNAALDQAVQSGLITEAQASELRQRGSAFPFGNRWQEWLSQNGIDFDALLANALGITADRLAEARSLAYTARIDQAVADGRITQEQADLLKGKYALFNSESFRSSMQAAFEAAVNQAVADGVITQAQADRILENQGEMQFRGMLYPRLRGERGLRGDGFGRGDRLAPSYRSPATPQTTPSTGV
jgi:hypothetical protein